MTIPKGGHIEVIEAIAKGLKAEGNNQIYLELGYAKGACFDKVSKHFKESVTVDIDLTPKIVPGHYYFKGTTDEFFVERSHPFYRHNNDYNLIFIDADHHLESVKEDFINSFLVLKKNGLIILHDTWPESKAYTKYCFDAWKIKDYLNNLVDMEYMYKSDIPKFEFCTLPFHSGMTIVRKK